MKHSKHRCRVAAAVGLAMALGASAAPAGEKAKPPASIWEQETLTGDWNGARTGLKDKGIDITLNYIGETLDVLSGGLERRGAYAGRLELSIDTDLQKLAGWTGGSTRVIAYQIQNTKRGIAAYAGSVANPSNIDAVPSTRLFTVWFEQSFNDRASLRIGQLAADDEFFTSSTASGLIVSTFAWGTILSANMTSGGPVYPLATPGVRLKVSAFDDLTLLAAVFSGNPAGRDCNDVPQECNKHGTTFSFVGGSLSMGEAQYTINQGKDAKGLAGVYKLGFWYATADFADQHFGLDAGGAVVSLADPAVVGPLNHAGNWGIYGVADQMAWRTDDGKRSLSLFVRSGFSPGDRNLLSFYIDSGFGFKGLLPDCPDDVLTFGVAYAKISPSAADRDRDMLAFAGPPFPIRDYEVVFELSYQAKIAKWWIVQPDLQYIVHPGGNVPDPRDPTGASTIANAFVVGLRSTIKF